MFLELSNGSNNSRSDLEFQDKHSQQQFALGREWLQALDYRSPTFFRVTKTIIRQDFLSFFNHLKVTLRFEESDSILGSTTLIKDKDEALEAPRSLLTRSQAKRVARRSSFEQKQLWPKHIKMC